MAFKDVAGNEGIKRILRLALERGRVPNSLIFAGPEGVGKSEMALTLAKALNCDRLTTDSCDACPSCLAIDNGNHPDVMTLAAEVQKVKVEQTDLIKQMAYLRPMTGKRRVFIIEEAKKLNDRNRPTPCSRSSRSRPPSLTSSWSRRAPSLLLPTIRSRCRMLAFSPIGREEIEASSWSSATSARSRPASWPSSSTATSTGPWSSSGTRSRPSRKRPGASSRRSSRPTGQASSWTASGRCPRPSRRSSQGPGDLLVLRPGHPPRPARRGSGHAPQPGL